MLKSIIASNPIVVPTAVGLSGVMVPLSLGDPRLRGDDNLAQDDSSRSVAAAFIPANEKAGVETLIRVNRALRSPFDLSDLFGKYRDRGVENSFQFLSPDGASMTSHRKNSTLKLSADSDVVGLPAGTDDLLAKFLKAASSPAAEISLLNEAISGSGDGSIWLRMVELAVTGRNTKYDVLLEAPLVKRLMAITKEPICVPSDNVTPASRTPWGGTKIASLLGGLGFDGFKDVIVGEAWVASGHPKFPSKVKVVYEGEIVQVPLQILGKITGPHLYGRHNVKRFGTEMPFLVKLLDSAQALSIQVHPKPDYPGLKPGQHSKTEAWAILEAEEGAGIYLGLKDGVTKEMFEATLRSGGDVSVHLNFIPVKPSDVFFIPSGMIHAVGAGVTLVEPQETSETTYRVYDWGRLGTDGKPRELHVDDTLAATDWDGLRGETLVESLRRRPKLISGGGHGAAIYQNLVSQKEFEFNAIVFNANDSFDETADRGVESLLVAEGTVELSYPSGKIELFEKGESILIPANVQYLLKAASDGAVVFQTRVGSPRRI